MRRFFIVAACLLSAVANNVSAQWTLQDSHSNASLRGIHYVGNGIAWASGSAGTVLRTTDMGKTWTRCTVPDGAEKLDFRGVQAFNAETAIVMSSGTGDLSRLYKTVDGCKTWKLVLSNPDKDGFWDALVVATNRAFLIGDPVNGRFVLYVSRDGNFEQWERFGEKTNILHFPYSPSTKESLFAASNSIAEGDPVSNLAFVTGGESGARFYLGLWNEQVKLGQIGAGYFEADLPLERGASAGAFSLGSTRDVSSAHHYVVVGGDYAKPDAITGTAAFSKTVAKAGRVLDHFPTAIAVPLHITLTPGLGSLSARTAQISPPTMDATGIR